jgi:hypothetical protein
LIFSTFDMVFLSAELSCQVPNSGVQYAIPASRAPHPAAQHEQASRQIRHWCLRERCEPILLSAFV